VGHVAAELKDARTMVAKLADQISILEELEKVGNELISIVSTSVYCKQIWITPSDPSRTRQLLRVVQGELHKPMAKKEFNEGTGKLEYNIKMDNGWTVTISGADPACEIRKVTRDVWIDAQEGHYSKRTSYELVDPEGCREHGTSGEMSPFEGGDDE
jgi:hypothetical protein